MQVVANGADDHYLAGVEADADLHHDPVCAPYLGT